MKKFLVIWLLMLYGASSMGMTLHFHYCCGKLKTVDLVPAQHHCGKANTHHMNDKACCDDQQVNLKIDDTQLFSGIYYPSFHTDAATSLNDLHLAAVPDFNASKSLQSQTAGLLPGKERIHWLCIYRI